MTDPAISAYINVLLMMVRFELMGKVYVSSVGLYTLYSASAGGSVKILAFGLDFTQSAIQEGIEVSYKELLDEAKNNGVSLTEITKEQFYDLNA